MPVIANRNQQVYTGGLAPKALYSRVVSLQLEVSDALPMPYQYTPVLGNNIWVLGIKAWVMPKIPNSTKRTTLYFRCGVGVPTSAAVMADWVNLLSKYHTGVGDPGWFFFDGDTEKYWAMARRFEGESRRLGVYGTRDTEDADEVQVSFLISEG